MYKRFFFSKKNINFFIYVQSLEIFKWECIYKNIQCVYVSCNYYMLASFLFSKKMIDVFLSYLMSYFISRNFLFYLVFLFFNKVKTFTVQGGSQMKFLKKLRLRSLPYQAGLKINLVRSDVSAWMYESVQYFSFLIFLIFSILAFRKRCMSVLRTYEHIYEILGWFMRMYVWNT